MGDLASQKCVPCRAGTPPITGAARQELQRELDPGWRVENDHHLVRDFQFADFATALAFTNRVGAIAEAEGHHPDLELGWGRVRITLWTHAIDGLSESDFVLAAKVDRLPTGA
jgi:4a-hydroxytetrahydrobiopterin dehydratase